MATLTGHPNSAPRPPGTVRRLLRSAQEHPAPALFAIMALGLILGSARLYAHPPSFDFNWENRWWQIAVNVARGEGYIACKPTYFPFCGPENQVTAMREPLPVLLFALVAWVTHESLMAVAGLLVLVNVATTLAIFLLARELANEVTGLLAALLWVSYVAPVQVFYSQPSGDLLAALALTTGMLYFVQARRTGRTAAWCLAGVCVGLAILSRSAVLVIACSLTVGQLLWPEDAMAGRPRLSISNFRAVALFTLGWASVGLPWITRNYLAFGRPVIGSSLSGYYLYRQNHHLPSDDYLRFVTGAEFVPVIRQMVARRSDLKGTENEALMDRVYREEAFRVIAAEPVRYLMLSGYRSLTLWFNLGVKGAYRQRNSTDDYLLVVQHVLLLAGAVVGLRGRGRRAWPLLLAVAALSLLHMAVMAHITYVASVVPLLVTLSAIACADLTAKVHLMADAHRRRGALSVVQPPR
jgi:hypothetical protein